MKKNNTIYTLLFSIMLLSINMSLFSMHNAILNQFQQDITTNKVTYQNISTDLLRIYRQHAEKIKNQALVKQISKYINASGYSYLIPTDEDILKKLQLCPPSFSKNLLFTIFEEEPWPQYSRYNVNEHPACIVPNWNGGTLMQLFSLNQIEFSSVKDVDSAHCSGLSLRNCIQMQLYANTGDNKLLTLLHNFDNAKKFLDTVGAKEWGQANQVREYLREAKIKGFNVDNISVIEMPLYLDPGLLQSKEANIVQGVFDKKEFEYVQAVKQKISNGIKGSHFFHAMIIGNLEQVEGRAMGHWFSFVIIKNNNTIQYIVLDTISKNYHLVEFSYEMQRLQSIVNHIIKGYSNVQLQHAAVALYFKIDHYSKQLQQELDAAGLYIQEEQPGLVRATPNEPLYVTHNEYIKDANMLITRMLFSSEGIRVYIKRMDEKDLKQYQQKINVLNALYGLYPTLKKLIDGEINYRK